MEELLRRIGSVAMAMNTQSYTSKQLRKAGTDYSSEFALAAGSDHFMKGHFLELTTLNPDTTHTHPTSQPPIFTLVRHEKSCSTTQTFPTALPAASTGLPALLLPRQT